MNYILVILVSCIVISAKSSDVFENVPRIQRVTYTLIPTNGLLDSSLVDEVNQFVVEKVEEFNTKIDNFNNISEETQIEVDGILEDAKKKIEDFFDRISLKIADLKRRGGIYKKCAEQYEIELKEARSVALIALKECTLRISKALKDFAVEVGSEAVSISKNVMYLVSIVKNCYDQNGKLDKIKCAFRAIKEVMEKITIIVKGIVNLVDAIKVNTKEITTAVRDCNENYIKVAQAKFQEYDNKVAQCYKLEAFFIF